MTTLANQLGVVKRNIVRADKVAVEKLSKFGVATIHEAQGRVGLMKPYMRPIYPGARVCGTAVTVLTQPGDNWMLHVVAEQIKHGDVVVLTCTSENNDGMFGDLLATSFQARGCAGLISDTGVRDVKDLASMNFPVFAKNHSCQGHDQGYAGLGEYPRRLCRCQCQPRRRGHCRRGWCGGRCCS